VVSEEKQRGSVVLINFNAKYLSNIQEHCTPFPTTAESRGEMLCEVIVNAWSQVYSEGVMTTKAFALRGGIL
jgi:hypothetical protein